MVPEWEVVQRAVKQSLANEPGIWAAFRDCKAVEVYTDGSAPIKNPGGPAGFAAVVVGFATEINDSRPDRPPEIARIELGGFIEGRKTEPKTSNNRAEISGLMAAYEAIGHLRRLGCAARKITIWSDSQYAIYCATGVWQRKKNTDLWPILDKLMSALGKSSGVKIEWVRGHAGNMYNEIADELATLAAFDFDDAKYRKFRAAQQATGKEMPGQTALKEQGVSGEAAGAKPPIEPIDLGAWSPNADYMLVLNSQIVRGGHPIKGPRQGEYRLWARDGRNRTHTLETAREQAPDEAEYTTLIHALDRIAAKIGTAGRKTSEYSLIVYSRMELMIKQLTGEYRVKAPALQNAYTEASSLIKRFKNVELQYRDGKAIKQMMQE